MRNHTRMALLVPAVALLAACSSPASNTPPKTSTSSSTSSSGTSSSAPSATTQASTPSTGAELKTALVTDMPPGFKLDPAGTVDTGTSPQDEVNGSMKNRTHCADLDATSWIQVSGMSGVAFAQSTYVNGQTQEIAQEIDSFDSPEHAARALSQLTAFMKTCTTFREANSTDFRLTVSSIPGLGQGAIKGVMTSPRIEGGVVDVAAVSGNNVITVLYSARDLQSAERVPALADKIRANLNAH